MNRTATAKAVESPAKCTVRACNKPLRTPGTGCGCTNPDCSNFWKKWHGQGDSVPQPDRRAALLAAIAAKKKGKK